MPSAFRFLLLALCTMAVTLGMLASGCTGADEGTVSTREGGVPATSIADGSWATTGCGRCSGARCSGEKTRCASEPTCARHLECVFACPVTADFEPQPECVAACPSPEGSAALAASEAFSRCNTAGEGLSCRDCRARKGGYSNPLLNQSCPEPIDRDVPDATPIQEVCTICGRERCCDSYRRCKEDPACMALQDCMQLCVGTPGTTCTAPCYAKYDSALAAYNEKIHCAILRCGEECGVVVQDPCVACTYDSCADDFMACQSDHDCFLLEQCYGTCTTDDCRDTCRAKVPRGEGLLATWLLCLQERCPMCQ